MTTRKRRFPFSYNELTFIDLSSLAKFFGAVGERPGYPPINANDRATRKSLRALAKLLLDPVLRAKYPVFTTFCKLHEQLNPFPVTSLFDGIGRQLDKDIRWKWKDYLRNPVYDLTDVQRELVTRVVKAIRGPWPVIFYGYPCVGCNVAAMVGDVSFMINAGAVLMASMNFDVLPHSKRLIFLAKMLHMHGEQSEDEPDRVKMIWALGKELKKIQQSCREMRRRVKKDATEPHPERVVDGQSSQERLHPYSPSVTSSKPSQKNKLHSIEEDGPKNCEADLPGTCDKSKPPPNVRDRRKVFQEQSTSTHRGTMSKKGKVRPPSSVYSKDPGQVELPPSHSGSVDSLSHDSDIELGSSFFTDASVRRSRALFLSNCNETTADAAQEHQGTPATSPFTPSLRSIRQDKDTLAKLNQANLDALGSNDESPELKARLDAMLCESIKVDDEEAVEVDVEPETTKERRFLATVSDAQPSDECPDAPEQEQLVSSSDSSENESPNAKVSSRASPSPPLIPSGDNSKGKTRPLAFDQPLIPSKIDGKSTKSFKRDRSPLVPRPRALPEQHRRRDEPMKKLCNMFSKKKAPESEQTPPKGKTISSPQHYGNARSLRLSQNDDHLRDRRHVRAASADPDYTESSSDQEYEHREKARELRAMRARQFRPNPGPLWAYDKNGEIIGPSYIDSVQERLEWVDRGWFSLL